MNPYRFTHLSGRCRGGGDRAGFIVHLVPSNAGSMGSAACGKKPSPKSNGWSEHDDDKLTCPRCIEIATSEPLPEYSPVIGSGHINKIKFYWGEETYTLCVTKDDWWIDEPVDMPERMITYANELALENGMAPAADLCAGCNDGTYVNTNKDYHVGAKILENLAIRRCDKCGHTVLPSESVARVDEELEESNK